MKSKGESTLIIFFGLKGVVHKEFILAGQSVPCTAMMFYVIV
jgi:hypothetical protein